GVGGGAARGRAPGGMGFRGEAVPAAGAEVLPFGRVVEYGAKWSRSAVLRWCGPTGGVGRETRQGGGVRRVLGVDAAGGVSAGSRRGVGVAVCGAPGARGQRVCGDIP